MLGTIVSPNKAKKTLLILICLGGLGLRRPQFSASRVRGHSMYCILGSAVSGVYNLGLGVEDPTKQSERGFNLLNL